MNAHTLERLRRQGVAWRTFGTCDPGCCGRSSCPTCSGPRTNPEHHRLVRARHFAEAMYRASGHEAWWDYCVARDETLGVRPESWERP